MSQPLSFFNLPAELCNMIYGYTIPSSPFTLTPRTRGRLASTSALMLVCRQTKAEFSAQLYAQSTTIVAHVKDYNFGHIVSFFNKPSETELKVLKTKKCEVLIRLEHSRGRCCVRPHIPEGLSSFIHRTSNYHKPGSLGFKWSFECVDWQGLASAVHEVVGDRLRGWRLLHPSSQAHRKVDRVSARGPRTKLMQVHLALVKAESKATA